MNLFIIIGELNEDNEGRYKINYCGTFFENYVKMVLLKYNKKFKKSVGKPVLVKVTKALVKNKTIYCSEYDLSEVN